MCLVLHWCKFICYKFCFLLPLINLNKPDKGEVIDFSHKMATHQGFQISKKLA